ncbi:LysR family transcriptional regulator [Clostridium estertheticum]|uniref:LysR family transcriptional regulator n=1 Tax=Clostridium estertheticum TaxID=238834 RepID=UPI001C0C2741|nr:LysR family transcriptional regulator [Clostridium estertheticum]MBU3202359.1 LysR family transcriptional regulator [Clostridium estertheticum]WAG66523.1 LysR family transcriptional regulator [Clostridium estertheticum]
MVMNININNLKIFISVADEKSITEAANNLYISQPAVSKAIKNLEDNLSIKLFQRDKRNGLLITDVGEKILLHARQMVNIENKIYQTAFRDNNFLGSKVKIGSIPIASTVILSKAISIFKQKYPFVSVELLEGSSDKVKKMVEDHIVDFGIGISPFNDLNYQVLFKDEMVGIISEEQETVDHIDLREDQNNLIFCKSGQEATINQLHKDFKIRFNESLIVQNADTVVNMVKNGVGKGVISKFVLSSVQNDLTTCTIYPPIKMEIGLIAHSFDDLTPVASEFVRVIYSVQNNFII